MHKTIQHVTGVSRLLQARLQEQLGAQHAVDLCNSSRERIRALLNRRVVLAVIVFRRFPTAEKDTSTFLTSEVSHATNYMQSPAVLRHGRRQKKFLISHPCHPLSSLLRRFLDVLDFFDFLDFLDFFKAFSSFLCAKI